MKGVILAAGKGTRLLPNTKILPKTLLPIYDRPMIFYAVEAMIEAGIEEVMIVVSPTGEMLTAKTLEGEFDDKIKITYKTHATQLGSVDAFRAAKDYIRGNDCLLYFSDNIFSGVDFKSIVEEGKRNLEKNCSSIITYEVPNPKQLGVVEADDEGNIISIEEKPEFPKSNLASIGVYIYTKDVVDKMDDVELDFRGEYQITDLNNMYLAEGRLKAIRIKSGKWYDTGNADKMLEAANEIKHAREETDK